MRQFRWYAKFLPNPYSRTDGIRSKVGYVYHESHCVEVRRSSKGHFTTQINWEYLLLEGTCLLVLREVKEILESGFPTMQFDDRMEFLKARGYVKNTPFFCLNIGEQK